MKNLMRNLTLSAAALAALTVSAPKASAQPWKGFPLPPSPHEIKETIEGRQGGHGPEFRGRGYESPRQEFREERREHGYGNYGNHGGNYGNYGYRGNYGNYGHYGYRGYGADRGYRNYGHAYVSPGRSYVRRGYSGYASPFRVFSGFRFYNDCPGDGYVYITDLGWAQPPYSGAEWVSGYYDDDDCYVGGAWR